MNEVNLLYLFVILLFVGFAFYVIKHKNKNKNVESKVEKNLYNKNEDQILKSTDLPFIIQKSDESILKTGQLIAPNHYLKEYSNNILRLAKSNAIHLSKDKEVFEVIFSETVQEEIKKGTVKLMDSLQKEGYQRALAVNSKGTIIEHANVKSLNYNPAQLKALAINTLTIVVSQEHLQEIRKELDKIQHSLNRVILMRKNEYYGNAKGSYDYLKRAYSLYLNGEINDRVFNQLETIYRENISSIYSLIKDLDDVTTQVYKLKKKVWIWKTDTEVNNLRNIIKEYDDYKKLINLCFMNVNSCLKLMELYGDSESVIEHSITDANHLLETIKENKQHFLKELNSYSKEFRTRLSTSNYLIEKQKNIKMEIEKVKKEEGLYIKRTLSLPPDKIYLAVENGEVVSILKENV
ncbi:MULTISPECIES: hypothetical protein [Priestia]|uniref:hypothetical protein n=1 Tax=Priestia TaxID=2800373 RepID=UPI0012B773C2|nr:hypothetical protein [Priestia megaterium]